MRCALFDLDDTLYDFTAASKRALDGACREAERLLGIPADDVRADYARILHEQQTETPDDAGCHSRLIRFARMLEERGLPLSYADVITDAYWKSFLDGIVPFPGAADALDGLRAAGVRIGLGTNMTADWQYRKLARLGLIDRFDFIVSSEEAGAEKPTPRFFALCVRKARCPAAECLFVGDNLHLDIFGALAAGMQAVWFQPDPAKRAEHPEVRSIARLSELMGYPFGARVSHE